MKLKEVAKAAQAIKIIGNPDIGISSVTHDSRKVTSGSLFVAVLGTNTDGARFVHQAVKAGAVAVMTDHPLTDDPGVPVVLVENIRKSMALASVEVYGRPADNMVMIGITGTNGKTTTTYLIESVLFEAGFNPGIIGTVNVRYGGRTLPTPMTTPEGPDLQHLLRDMKAEGVTHVVMEVSSHALDLHRVAGCRFDIALFTNLTQDHLDYHGDMNTYFEAKKRLFNEYLTGGNLEGGPRAIINVDDQYGAILARDKGSLAITFGVDLDADARIIDHRADRRGVQVQLKFKGESFELHSPLLGDFNFYNLMSAFTTSIALGVDEQVIVSGLQKAGGVPGRIERVGDREDYLVLVDYAHTPDALARVLAAAGNLNPRRLLTVFGCGGDRDRGKRPMMGQAAGKLSDLVVVTSDNPRTEKPLSIIEDIEKGLTSLGLKRVNPEQVTDSSLRAVYVVIPDRRAALGWAVKMMESGDIVVVAGKGHEDYQILGKEKIHFDDREEVLSALRREGKL